MKLKIGKKVWIVLAIVVLIVVVLLLIQNRAKAEETSIIVTEGTAVKPVDTLKNLVQKVPTNRHGVFINIQDSDVDYITTWEVYKPNLEQKYLKDRVTVELGYSPKITLLGVIAYRVGNLKDLGVTIPLIDVLGINIGAGVGYSRIALHDTAANNEFKWGLTATILDVKW